MTRSERTSQNSPDSGPVTLNNVFEIRPEQLDGFLGEWHQRAKFMSKQPGFQSFGSTAPLARYPVSIGQRRRAGQRRSAARRDYAARVLNSVGYPRGVRRDGPPGRLPGGN